VCGVAESKNWVITLPVSNHYNALKKKCQEKIVSGAGTYSTWSALSDSTEVKGGVDSVPVLFKQMSYCNAEQITLLYSIS
jgi:hypothetical protein